MRAQADAIAIGIGTALADNPALTVRQVRRPRVTPVRVVFDRSVRLPLGSVLATTAPTTPTVVVAGRRSPKRELALFHHGVEVLHAATLRRALAQLAAHEVRSLFVEGGPTLAAALLAARLVDRIVIFQSPRRLGAGAIAAFDDASLLDRYRVVSRRRFGPDVMTVYDVHTPRT